MCSSRPSYAIEKAFPKSNVELIEGGKGDFIVKADGAELWNKKQMGDEFPEPEVILEKMQGSVS